MTYKYGDVVLVKFPYTNLSESKPRPSVVISNDNYNQKRNDLILMAITSQIAQLRYGDQRIYNLEIAGLIKPSGLKGTVFTIEQQMVHRRLGRLSHKDRKALNYSLKTIIGNRKH